MTEANASLPGRVGAVGMFDGVHRGHRDLLRVLVGQSRSRGALPVAFTFPSHPLALISPASAPALMSLPHEKEALLRECGVEEVVFLDFPAVRSLSGREFLCLLREKYGVEALVVGFNNHFGCDRMHAAEAARIAGETGVEIILAGEYLLPDGEDVSSSRVRKALLEGDVDHAALMLGRPYGVRGRVVGGRRLGRTIGFPTANLDCSCAALLIPAPGVYAVDVRIGDMGGTFRGMMNIGRRPTVDTSVDAAISLEVNVFDLDADLYGRSVRVDFLKRLRGERTFAGLDALRTQLEADREAARSV